MRGTCFRRTLSFLSLSLVLTIASNCSTQRELANEPEGDYPTLPGHFAAEAVTEPLVAVEAYIGTTDFFISYKSADGLVYSGGNWSNRIDIAAVEQSTDETYAGPYILPLEYQQRERWSEIPESPIIPRLLSSKQWKRFTEQLFDSILPKAEMTGIVMHFDDDDYFLYNNDINKFVHGDQLTDQRPVRIFNHLYRCSRQAGFL